MFRRTSFQLSIAAALALGMLTPHSDGKPTRRGASSSTHNGGTRSGAALAQRATRKRSNVASRTPKRGNPGRIRRRAESRNHP